MNIPEITYRDKGFSYLTDDIRYTLSAIRALSEINNISFNQMDLSKHKIHHLLSLTMTYHCEPIKYSLSELNEYYINETLDPESIDQKYYYYDWGQSGNIAKIIAELSKKYNLLEDDILLKLLETGKLEEMFEDDFDKNIGFEEYLEELYNELF